MRGGVLGLYAQERPRDPEAGQSCEDWSVAILAQDTRSVVHVVFASYSHPDHNQHLVLALRLVGVEGVDLDWRLGGAEKQSVDY